MRFKRYTLLSIVFLVIIGVYAHLNTEAIYGIDFFGVVVVLPIAVWMTLPAFLIIIASITHFGFYASLEFFKKSKLEKDLNKNEVIIINALLHNKSNLNIKDKRYKVIAELLLNSKLYIDKDYSFGNKDLDEVLSIIDSINSGEHVDLSKYKLEKDNEFFIKNQLNKLQSDPSYAEKILKDCDSNSELCNKAFEMYVKSADKKKINKIKLKKTKTIVTSMLERYNVEENRLEFSTDEIIAMCKEVEFTQDDFIKIVKILQKNLDPDMFLELCFFLQKEIEAASSAYMYANLELERNDVAKEYLEQFEEHDLVKFRYYMILKEKGEKVTLSDFV